MKVKIKQKHPDAVLPQYHTAGSVAFDLTACESVVIPKKSLGFIPTGLIIATPEGYMLTVVTRSSTPRKKGLGVPHGIGIVDQDYCGEEDEIKILVYNFTDQDVPVEKGERLGQAVFVKIEKAEWDVVDRMDAPTRGGFGSTG